MDQNDELKAEMINEIRMNFDELDQLLIHLEKNSTDTECLNEIFRHLHTIKGLASFFEYRLIEELAHTGEHLLELLRSNKLSVSSEIITCLLTTNDTLKMLIDKVEETNSEGQLEHQDLLDTLKSLCLLENDKDENLVEPTEQIKEQSFEPSSLNKDIKKKSSKENYIQIEIGLLDSLLNLIGELVLSRNQMLAHATDSNDHNFLKVCQVLNYVTTEIQENVMQMRLQPIKMVWSKFGRVIRDLALACGKKVELIMEGSETTLDKSIIDSIKDPLTHLIRNAVDHGIEKPQQRELKGKPQTGLIELKAYQENGQIIIEISDDGKGLEIEKIKEKAISEGLVEQSEISKMSKENILALIFEPGFSTKDEVTNISGRGVGMDVVKSNIEMAGGSVEVYSEIDAGSTFKVTIPLTLVIIPTLIIKLKELSFAIPQNSIVELIRVKAQNISKIDDVMVYRVRGELLPILSLYELLELPNKAYAKGIIQIIIIEVNDCRFGIIVDEIKSTQDIVVKPLSNKIKELRIYSGVTILGDGGVALILDLNELAQRANICNESITLGQDLKSVTKQKEADTHLVLLVENFNKTQVAVPIDIVKRLEKFSLKNIEHISGRNFVQYHGKILTLIKLSELINQDNSILEAEKNTIDVFVYANDDYPNIGIVVDKILDSSKENILEPQGGIRLGVKGTKIINNKITEILDIETLQEKIKAYVS